MQAEVLGWGRGGDGVAPGHAEPFHRPVVVRVAGDALEGVEDVAPAHLAQAVEEGAGVFQHDPRRLALPDQLRDELAHALVAPGEDGGIVVIADALVLHHVLEVADEGGAAQVTAAGRDQGLVHVQGDGGGGADLAEVDAPPVPEEGLGGAGGQGVRDVGLAARDIGDAFDRFGKRIHGWEPSVGVEDGGVGSDGAAAAGESGAPARASGSGGAGDSAGAGLAGGSGKRPLTRSRAWRETTRSASDRSTQASPQ